MAAHDLSAHVHHHEVDQFNQVGERRTLIVVGVAFLMMIGELIGGYMTKSQALKADGWHMGTHVGALGLTLVAYWYARTHAGHDAFSFGTGKVYALAGFASGVVLVIVALLLGVECIEKLVHQETPDYMEALPIAVLGLVVNGGSALLLGGAHHYGHAHGGHAHGGHAHTAHDHAHDHDHDHAHGHDHGPDHGRKLVAGTLDFNMRAAYIHIAADALTSLLAIIALSLGAWADLWFLDPATGLVGGLVIIWWAISLCRQASGQLLDVTSSPTHESVVRERLESIDDVRVADLHVWELGPGRRSCIVSVVTAQPRELEHYRQRVLEVMPLAHLTIEIHHCALPHAQPDAVT